MLPAYRLVVKGMDDGIEKLFNRAVELMEARKYKEATKLFQKVTEKDPSIQVAWHNLGIMRGCVKDYTGAVQALRKAVAIDPEKGDSLYVLGVALDRIEDYQAAIDLFRKVVASNPRQMDAWYSLGFAFRNFGDYKGAIDAYETCLRSNPGAEGRGDIEEDLKETCEAREHEIARLTKAKALFLKARDDIKKGDLSRVIKIVSKDISEGVFRNDAEIRALNKEHIDMMQERLRELSPGVEPVKVH
jgi:tetratricopeptide (TPR) repeat protein